MKNELLLYLESNKKAKLITIAVIAVVVLAIAIYIICKVNGIGKKIHDSSTNSKLAKLLDEEIDDKSITSTQMQLNGYASKLYAAMKGWGTDEDSIYDVFRQMQSRSDVLQLIRTFGVKDHMTLNEWLIDELSANEIDKVNQILANNGINYKF